MFQLGEKFGDYEVIQILGAGGMGQVYKVRNTISDRFEAMKVLLPNLEQQSDLADRFLREIKVQATLHHKNIAGLHTAQRQSDRILMFIEFVDGITLDKALQRGPLSPDLAATIIGEVLEALAYAHQRGIVHRDIKPENIMVQPDGVVKLMDFGIARLAQDRKLTSTGHTVGSLFYMSPEQIRGAEDLDGRSDLYSLGITLYQCITGKRPFDGDSDYSIMSAHIQVNPTPPIELDPRLPAALSDVIMKAIAKDRDSRYQTADAFRVALLASVKASAEPVRNATIPMAAPSKPVAPTILMPVSAPAPPPPPQPAAQSKKGLWLGIAALAAAAFGGVAFLQGPNWFASIPMKQDPVPVVTPDPKPVVVEQPKPVVDVLPKPVVEPAPPVSAPVAAPVKQAPIKAAPQPQPKVVEAVDVIKPPILTTPLKQVVPISAYQPPEPSKPAVDPQAQREMEELRQKFNSLSTRFSTAQESVRGIENQQQRQGLAMRRDVREGMGRFQYLMKESADSLASRNIEATRNSLNMAERSLERLEKFLGN